MNAFDGNPMGTERPVGVNLMQREVLLGALPFALLGLTFIWIDLVRFLQLNQLATSSLYALLGAYAFLVACLGVGWTRGFPRWSYPYLCFVLLFSGYWTTMTTPQVGLFGYIFQRNEFWGWRAWLLPLCMAVVALVMTRSLRPLLRLVQNIWQDWTLATFALYGTMPLLMWWSVDETRGLYPVVHLAVTSLVLTLGAIVYLRSTEPRCRAFALLIAVTLAATIALVGGAFYWDGRIEPWMRQPPQRWFAAVVQGLMLLPLWLALFFSPALLGLFRASRAKV